MSPPDPLTISRHGAVVVACLQGEFDLATAPPIAATVVEHLHDARALVVDLSDVAYFDSAGVRLLDGLAEECGAARIPIVVVAPTNGRARFVLQVVAFREDLLAETLPEALAAAGAAAG